MEKFKTIFIGDGGIGKTTLLFTYDEKKLLGEYIPTVFDTFSKNVIVFVFAIDRYASFENIESNVLHLLKKELKLFLMKLFLICIGKYDKEERKKDKNIFQLLYDDFSKIYKIEENKEKKLNFGIKNENNDNFTRFYL
ncbi:ras-related c3 botulinum toxin substrate 1 [Anaeramoeba ignava]|uniref:Ras-related c3 botulinum toxin substrate 1 n=1 Tax=Anaeramoeba ignava TaxID=1746090 RepID=A0A9Q0LPW4_ANAIG|nr:ras-related c3 botulinum toxin substrate 1 [Anaeramoeba ignava]